MFTRPADLNAVPADLPQGLSFDPTVALARAAYGIGYQGFPSVTGPWLASRWDYVQALDNDKSGFGWAREFNFVPSEANKDFGRFALLTNVVATLAESQRYFGALSTLRIFRPQDADLVAWLNVTFQNGGKLAISDGSGSAPPQGGGGFGGAIAG